MPASLVLVPRAMNFLDDPIFFEIESALMNGGSAGAYEPDEVNLWCYVKVAAVDSSGGIGVAGEFKLPYSPVNKRCQGDLSGVMGIQLMAPNRLALDTGIYNGILDHVRKVTILFNDAFGIPLALPTTLVSSAEFYVIAGGSKYYQGFGDGTDAGYLLHSRVGSNLKLYAKEVRRDQPEIINFWKASDGQVNIDVQFYYKDGTDSTHNVASISALGGKVNYVTAGWNQLDMDAVVDTSKELGFYRIVLSGIGGDNSMYYHLDDTLGDNDVYIAYHNGIGGVEIARFSGYHQRGIEMTATKVVKARTSNVNWQDGLIEKTNSKSRYTNKLVSGYYSREYIEELAQCMLSDAWLVDRSRQEFYKIYINPEDVTINDTDEDVHYLEITVLEHDRTTHHNFRY